MNARQTGQAVEYLRRSVERDKAADQDRGAGQRSANRAQAAAIGTTIERTFDADWGTSGGREKRDKRVAMAELIDAVRAGEVSWVFCHTIDRLARDVEYGMTLWNACKDAGTLIRAGSQTFDPREPGYLTLWTVILAQAEEDRDRMARKNSDVSSWRAEHIRTCDKAGRPHEGRCHLVGCDRSHCQYSHRIGHPDYGGRPGEDLEAVVQAFRDAGSVLGAAKLLNGRGVPTRQGRSWSTTSVRDILVRAGAMPHRGRQGAKAAAPFILYRLLRCHCGATMTGSRYRNGSDPAYTTYRCITGRTTASHTRQSISERRLLPWVMAEAGRFEQVQRERLATFEAEVARDDAKRDALEARRLRLLDQYEAGDISRERYRDRLAAIADELAQVETVATVVDVPPIDWAGDPKAINALLRTLWDHVQLDADLRPVEAAWKLPPDWIAPTSVTRA